jgi:hypothetical protein
VWVVLFALLLQVTDSLTALRETRERFTDTDITLVTDDPRWVDWTKGKKHLVSIPPLNNDPLWIDLATLADRHRLTTNAAYVSRTDIRRFERLIEVTQKNLESYTFDPDTLYIITNYPPNPMSATLRKRADDLGFKIHDIPVRGGDDALVILTQ